MRRVEKLPSYVDLDLDLKKKVDVSAEKGSNIMNLINKFRALCPDEPEVTEMGGTAKPVMHRAWGKQPNAFPKPGEHMGFFKREQVSKKRLTKTRSALFSATNRADSQGIGMAKDA